jgi:hypothetical protein
MKTKPSTLQKRAVQNILSGKFKSTAAAMRDAGYSETTSHRPAEKLARSKGVQAYLHELGDDAIAKWGMSIENKVMDVYLSGLEATKLVGKNAVSQPDWQSRLQFANSFASFFGWKESQPKGGKIHQQFDYFGIPEDQKAVFNKKFENFLREYYRT